MGPVPVPSWWFDKEQVGGGALLDLGSHMIDLLSWYFGNVDYVHCFLGYMFKSDLEDAATCVLNFHSGPIATVKVGWFSKGYLQSVQICGSARNTLIQLSPPSGLRTIWNDVRRKVGLNVQDPNYLKLEHFVDCLIRDEQPQPSGEEGMRSLQIISLAYKNAQNNNEYCKPEGN
jgi:predicted dehydrogenase